MVDTVADLCPALALHIKYLYGFLCHAFDCTAPVVLFFIATAL